MIETRIAWLAALQILMILIGHAAGIAGESWCRRVWGGTPAPAVTAFYAHSGLWLLALPLLWFTGFMINQKVSGGRALLSVWVAVGTILLAGLVLYGVAALLCTMSVPMTKLN
jgi:hypothetical protein